MLLESLNIPLNNSKITQGILPKVSLGIPAIKVIELCDEKINPN